MITHKGTQELHTERLKLRKYALSDAALMFKNYASDERLQDFSHGRRTRKLRTLNPF